MAAPVPTLLLRPEGSRDRSGVVTPTLSGGVLTVPGQHGQAWQVAEATTNYAPNPVANAGTGGYYLGGSATMSRVMDRPDVHSTAIRVQFNPAAYSYIQHNSAAIAPSSTARIFTVSYWAVGNGKVRISASFHGGTGGTVYANNVEYTLTDTPQRLTFTPPAQSNGFTAVVVYLQSVSGTGWATEATWSKVQIEEKAYATPYCDGSLGPGHAWTGTAHASSSTRSNATVRWPNDAYVPDKDNYTILFRGSLLGLPPPPASPGYRYHWGGDAGSSQWPAAPGIQRWSDGRMSLFAQYTAYNDRVYHAAADVVDDGRFDYALVVRPETITGYVNGQLLGSDTRSSASAWASGVLSNLQNVAAESVLVFEGDLGAARIADLYAMPRAWEWDALFPPDHPDLPAYRSRVFLLAPRIYTADRDNRLASEITRTVTHAAVDADIDRAGPKGQLQIAATDPAALPANGWIAPFLDVTHEDGTLDSAQMGLYQLDQPEITYDMTGQATASATGVDIVGQLEAWPLGTAQTTAVGDPIMQDVKDGLTALGFRHSLPDDLRTATTAISHGANVSWLARFNDLLAAIGYHALYATADGRLTSRPLRDPRQDTPARTYATGRDSAIVDPVTIRRAAGNLYNVVVAVKEDFQTGTALVAEARNDDPEHPWSTVALGREIAPPQPITVMEAVDEDALQAIADDRLARASMQETLTMDLLPDPTLAVHDVIEITGTDGPEGGRWSVESLAWGLTADSPLVRLGARRTYTTTSPEGA